MNNEIQELINSYNETIGNLTISVKNLKKWINVNNFILSALVIINVMLAFILFLFIEGHEHGRYTRKLSHGKFLQWNSRYSGMGMYDKSGKNYLGAYEQNAGEKLKDSRYN
jgi:hypothetical protein